MKRAMRSMVGLVAVILIIKGLASYLPMTEKFLNSRGVELKFPDFSESSEESDSDSEESVKALGQKYFEAMQAQVDGEPNQVSEVEERMSLVRALGF